MIFFNITCKMRVDMFHVIFVNWYFSMINKIFSILEAETCRTKLSLGSYTTFCLCLENGFGSRRQEYGNGSFSELYPILFVIFLLFIQDKCRIQTTSKAFMVKVVCDEMRVRCLCCIWRPKN